MADNRQRSDSRDEEICAMWPTRVEGMYSGEMPNGLKVVMFANDRNSRGPAFRIMKARNQEDYKPRETARPTREQRTVPHEEHSPELERQRRYREDATGRPTYSPAARPVQSDRGRIYERYRDDYGPPPGDDDYNEDPGDI